MNGVVPFGTDVNWKHSLHLSDIVNPWINKQVYSDIFADGKKNGILYSLRVIYINQYRAINNIKKMQKQSQHISLHYGKKFLNFVINDWFKQMISNLTPQNEQKIDITLRTTKKDRKR